MRAAELVLELGDLVDQGLDVEGIATEGMRCDLTMENLDGGVGVVRRHLTPALCSLVRAHTNERDVRRPEAFDRDDAHGPNTRMLRSASPLAAEATASLTSGSAYRPVISSSSLR